MNNRGISIELDVANEVKPELLSQLLPELQVLEKIGTFISEALDLSSSVVCTLRLVSESESRELNHTYREKDYATNVLSFPADLPDYVQSNFIGDIAVCAEVVKDEAISQNKSIDSHMLHIATHGVLHLLGYDHIDAEQAEVMESVEIAVLAQLGIDDPYQVQ